MMKSSMKGQMWFMDFVIGIVIFSLVLVSYYIYTTNISKVDTAALDDLTSDAKTIASSFTSPGFPPNWDSNNVVRIGFTDGSNRIDNNRFNEFMEIGYNKTKKLLGTTYDYLLFFVNESNDVQNVEGFCGAGGSEVKLIYDINAAYYWKDEDKLRQFMIDTFDADIYQDKTSQDIDQLIANINNYGLVVIESPEFDTSTFSGIKDDIEAWAAGGGLFMLSARPAASQNKELLGARFNKVFGDSGQDKPATVVNADDLIAFNYADQIIFNQVYHVTDDSIGASFKDIARFNESDVEIEDIMDNMIAIARWPYGSGEAIFFSDFDATYLAGNFQEILEGSLKKLVGATCLSVNIANVKRDNLVRVERMVAYNSDLIKMVLYLWN